MKRKNVSRSFFLVCMCIKKNTILVCSVHKNIVHFFGHYNSPNELTNYDRGIFTLSVRVRVRGE